MRGLTLAQIVELSACDGVNLRQLVKLVADAGVEPCSVIKGIRRYRLIDIERAVKRYQRADD